MSESTPSQPVPSFGEACDRGRVREENQDCVRHVSTAMGELLLVADGIGGYRGGGTASGIVVESFGVLGLGFGSQLLRCPGHRRGRRASQREHHGNRRIGRACLPADGLHRGSGFDHTGPTLNPGVDRPHRR